MEQAFALATALLLVSQPILNEIPKPPTGTIRIDTARSTLAYKGKIYFKSLVKNLYPYQVPIVDMQCTANNVFVYEKLGAPGIEFTIGAPSDSCTAYLYADTISDEPILLLDSVTFKVG